MLGRRTGLTITALASLALAGISLGASTLHLGRPIYAFRALKGLRRVVVEPRSAHALAVRRRCFGVCRNADVQCPGRSVVGLCTTLARTCGRHQFCAHLCCSRASGVVQLLIPCSNSIRPVCSWARLFVQILLVQLLGGAIPSWVPLAAVVGASVQLIDATTQVPLAFAIGSVRIDGFLVTAFGPLAKICSLPAWPYWPIAGVLLPLVATRGW